jgi:hypothetical protein
VNLCYCKDQLDLYGALQHTSPVSSISSKEIDFSPLLERAFFLHVALGQPGKTANNLSYMNNECSLLPR